MAGKVCSVFVKVCSGLALWAFSFAVQAGCTKGLTVTYSDWPPYHYVDEDGKPAGLDIEILGKVLSSINCPFTLKFVSWKRAQREIDYGSVDVGLAASKNTDRETYAWFSESYRRESMVMFIRKGAEIRYNPHSLSELAETNYTIGLILGVWYGENLDELFRRKPAFRPRVLQSLEKKSLLKGLVRGRVDIVVSDLFNGVFAARREGILEEITVRPEIINDNENHFMFSRKTTSEAEMERINVAISKFKKTAAYRDLFPKYVPQGFLPRGFGRLVL